MAEPPTYYAEHREERLAYARAYYIEHWKERLAYARATRKGWKRHRASVVTMPAALAQAALVKED